MYDDYYTIEIGKAKPPERRKRCNDNYLWCRCSLGFRSAKSNSSISADLIDLRTLVPLDEEVIFDSVRKTSKAIVLHEDCMIGGFGADLSALITEELL